jgi:hypothetical protein
MEQQNIISSEQQPNLSSTYLVIDFDCFEVQSLVPMVS